MATITIHKITRAEIMNGEVRDCEYFMYLLDGEIGRCRRPSVVREHIEGSDAYRPGDFFFCAQHAPLTQEEISRLGQA